MGRRFKFDSVEEQPEPKDESLLESADAWRKSVKISRATFYRWTREFGLKPVYIHGRKFLCRKTTREFEKKVLDGAFGSTPSVCKPTEVAS
jgi:hypothetical protein